MPGYPLFSLRGKYELMYAHISGFHHAAYFGIEYLGLVQFATLC